MSHGPRRGVRGSLVSALVLALIPAVVAEPTKTGSGADGTYCIYSASDITFMP